MGLGTLDGADAVAVLAGALLPFGVIEATKGGGAPGSPLSRHPGEGRDP
jgi:hypothetical protein